MRERQRQVQFGVFFFVGVVYLCAILLAYNQANQLFGRGFALFSPRRAWLLEALPWLLACSSACVLAFWRGAVSYKQRMVIGFALFVISSMWMTYAPLVYSKDLLRYLWDGRLLLHGVSPYAYVPLDPHLAVYRAWPYWGLLDWKRWPEAYPPVAQVYFAAIAWLSSGSVLGYKMWMWLNSIVSVVLFYVVLRTRRNAGNLMNRRFAGKEQPKRDGDWHPQDVQAFVLFLLFPPLLFEGIGSGHVDVLCIPWLLAAWLFHLKKHPIGVGVAVGMAAAIKVYPLLFLVAFWTRRDIRGLFWSSAACVATLCVTCVPFLRMGGSPLAFLGRLSQMDYNGSLEAVLVKVWGRQVDQYSTLLIVFAVLLVSSLLLFTRLHKLPVERKVGLLGLTFLFASPMVHPWYVLPLLPFAVMGQDFAVLWFAFASHFTYDEVPLDMYVEYLPSYAGYLYTLMSRPKVQRPLREQS